MITNIFTARPGLAVIYKYFPRHENFATPPYYMLTKLNASHAFSLVTDIFPDRKIPRPRLAVFPSAKAEEKHRCGFTKSTKPPAVAVFVSFCDPTGISLD